MARHERREHQVGGGKRVGESERPVPDERHEHEADATPEAGADHRTGKQKRGHHQPDGIAAEPDQHLLVVERAGQKRSRHGDHGNSAHRQRPRDNRHHGCHEDGEQVPATGIDTRRWRDRPDQRAESERNQEAARLGAPAAGRRGRRRDDGNVTDSRREHRARGAAVDAKVVCHVASPTEEEGESSTLSPRMSSGELR
jgi:hypothetical protein